MPRDKILYSSENKKVGVLINGVEYLGFKDTCKKFKVSYNTVNRRLNLGWSLAEAFGLKIRTREDKCKGKIYVIKNSCNKKVYVGLTIRDLEIRWKSHKYNAYIKRSNNKFSKAIRAIGAKNFRIHLLFETSCRQELGKMEVYYINKYNSIIKGYNTVSGGGSISGKRGISMKYKGKKFHSIKQMADYFDLPYVMLTNRIKKGLPISAPYVNKKKRIEFQGLVYDSIKDLAKHLNMPAGDLSYRLINDLPLKATKKELIGKKIEYEGKLYDSHADLASYLNITPALLHYRLKNKVDLKRKPNHARSQKVVYNNKIEFDSMKECSDYLSIPISTLYYKIKTKAINIRKIGERA